jgi:selenide, water dikinase
VMTRLNRVGTELARTEAVHGITDVTGFGVLGHALGMARGAGLRIRLSLEALPLLPSAERLAKAGFATGASSRNWASYGEAVRLPPDLPLWRQKLLTDPQTSGGLLVAVEPAAARAVLADIHAAGFPQASIIGRTEAGAPEIVVEG